MNVFSCFSPCVGKCASADRNGAHCNSSLSPPPPPVMETCCNEALTNTAPVQILSGDAQPWRVASPQDQPLLSQLSPGCLKPLALLGEGAYGCVELCRVSVPISITPSGDDFPNDQPHAEQHSTNALADSSTTSHPSTDSGQDPACSLRQRPGPNCAAGSTANAPTSTAGSEAVISPREEVVVRPGRFSVHRLRLSPHPSEPLAPSPCATPPAPSRFARLSRLHCRQSPLRASAPPGSLAAATPGSKVLGGSGVSLGTGASPTGIPAVTASGAWPPTPPSVPRPSSAIGPSGFGGCGGFSRGSLHSRPRSLGSATPAHSGPPSTRSSKLPPQSFSAANPSTPAGGFGSGSAAASAVLSSELVVAVKRIGYRRTMNRSDGGGRGREPDGCAACTGGAIGRGRGGSGPSRTRLSRMQAIELLQLARCRECPFIVRVFGCVQDDPRPVVSSSAVSVGDDGVGGGGYGNNTTSGVASTPKQSLRPSKLSPRRPQPASSSSPSCRIVMEWAEGGDLGSLIKALSARRGPCSDPSRERLLMSEESARFYLACLVEALSFLHGKGLLHRGRHVLLKPLQPVPQPHLHWHPLAADVKPANLLLTSDGRAKLGDLGMVCHLDRDGMAAGRAGTPNYMAPEVWAYGTGPKYSSYGANADLWSAGMVLYELLTGHLPASHPDEYLRRSWCFTPRHIAFSAELRDLLGRLLMPRPRRRLQSCAELVAHPWFAGFDWQGLRDGTLLAPYVPAAHRPLPSTTAHVLASGASVTAGVGLMPPLLEENGPSGAAATGSSRGTGSYAAAAVRAIFRVPSAGALRQSAPAATVAGTVSTGTPTAPIKAAPDSTASVSGQPATELQPCQESSAGESVRRDQLPASPTLSPTAAAAGPLSVWRSLVWPAAARSLTAGTSAPASAASSTMSLSAAYVASPQGTWLRRGASYASVYVRDVCTAASTAGGGGGSFGFIGPALASVLSPVLASPKPPNITKVASAAAVASGSGMPGLNPEGVASIRVGSNVTAETMAVATEAIRTISGSLPPLARYGGGSDCARAAPAICSCVLSASETPTTSHGTSPFLLSTAAAATGTVSDCAPLRVDSGTFPAGSGSSGGVGGGRAHSNSGPCYTGNGGNVVWQATPADGSLMGSIELQPPTDPIPAAHTQGQRFSLQRYNSTSGEPSVCPTRRLSQLAADTGKPGPCNVPSVFSGPSFSSSPLAATARQPGLLSALASLQQHVQGLGPTGRRAGWWLQQRLADAATLAATLPDQLQFAAAAAAAVMGGKMGEKSEGFPTTAMDRLCKSESGASPRNAGAAAHSSTCVVRSVVTSGACAGDVMSGQRPSDAEGDCGNEDMEAESLLKARISGTIAPLQQLAPVTSSAEVCELAAATHSSHDNEAFDDSMPPADATGFASAPAGNVPTACHSGETPLDSYQLAASCWSTSGRRPSSGELSDEPHDSSRRASRPAVPPLLLSLPPSLPPSMGEVTRGGADAATVVRLICRSTDCNAANVDAGVNIMPGVCGRSPSGSGAIGGGNQGMGEKPLYLLRGGSAIGSYSTSDGVQECGAGAAVGAAIHATAGATPRSRNLLASPRLAAPRNPPFAHKRTGSFCFDPLDQARSASQPTAAPATPRPSTQPSTPGRSRVRGTSFSFDVGGLLSAGLLLGGSPALLADDAGATAGTTAGIDIPIRHAPADSCSKPHSFSVGAACANPTAAAAVALAAVADVAAATVSLGQPSPRSPRLPQPTSGEPGSVAARKGRGSPASPSPSACASANATAGPGSALRYRLQDPGAPSASGSGPVARSHNSSNAAQPHQLQAYHQWHQWQAGEAVVLLYAACVAVLVMAWAVILEGPADGF